MLDKNQITEKLNQLTDFEIQRDLMLADKQALLDSLYTEEEKATIKKIEDRIAAARLDIEEEFASKDGGVSKNIEALTKEIKQAVEELGESVKAEGFHAVYAQGRTSWNTEALDKYIETHPELSICRQTGKSSVSMRRVK